MINDASNYDYGHAHVWLDVCNIRQVDINGMLNYLDNEMTCMQEYEQMEVDGIGDLKLAGLYDLARWDSGRRIHLNIGISAFHRFN